LLLAFLYSAIALQSKQQTELSKTLKDATKATNNVKIQYIAENIIFSFWGLLLDICAVFTQRLYCSLHFPQIILQHFWQDLAFLLCNKFAAIRHCFLCCRLARANFEIQGDPIKTEPTDL